jgi:hypothetical protein
MSVSENKEWPSDDPLTEGTIVILNELEKHKGIIKGRTSPFNRDYAGTSYVVEFVYEESKKLFGWSCTIAYRSDIKVDQ